MTTGQTNGHEPPSERLAYVLTGLQMAADRAGVPPAAFLGWLTLGLEVSRHDPRIGRELAEELQDYLVAHDMEEQHQANVTMAGNILARKGRGL